MVNSEKNTLCQRCGLPTQLCMCKEINDLKNNAIKFQDAGGNTELWINHLTEPEKTLLANMTESIGPYIIKLISRIAASFKNMDHNEAHIIKQSIFMGICKMAVDRAIKRSKGHKLPE